MKLLCLVERNGSHMEGPIGDGQRLFIVVDHRSSVPRWAVYISDDAGDDVPPAELGDESEFGF